MGCRQPNRKYRQNSEVTIETDAVNVHATALASTLYTHLVDELCGLAELGVAEEGREELEEIDQQLCVHVPALLATTNRHTLLTCPCACTHANRRMQSTLLLKSSYKVTVKHLLATCSSLTDISYMYMKTNYHTLHYF